MDFIISSDHAPGLIYKCSVARKYINQLENRLADGCYLTTVFPQVNLVLNILLNDGGGYYGMFVIGTETKLLESGIKDPSGNHWRTHKSMCMQAHDLRSIIDNMGIEINLPVILAAERYFAKYLLTLTNECYINDSKDSIAFSLKLRDVDIHSQVYISINNTEFNELISLRRYKKSDVMVVESFCRIGELTKIRFDPSNIKCAISNFQAWLIDEDLNEYNCQILSHNAVLLKDSVYYFDTNDSQIHLDIPIKNPMFFKYSFEIENLKDNAYFNAYKLLF